MRVQRAFITCFFFACFASSPKTCMIDSRGIVESSVSCSCSLLVGGRNHCRGIKRAVEISYFLSLFSKVFSTHNNQYGSDVSPELAAVPYSYLQSILVIVFQALARQAAQSRRPISCVMLLGVFALSRFGGEICASQHFLGR